MILFRTEVFLRSLFGERIWSWVRRFSPLPRHAIERICQRETRRVVMTGPFKGMRYVGGTIAGGYVPKLLGTYEKELHEVVERIQELRFERVINVGAADGYYAVGLARLNQTSTVIALEMEERGRTFIREMAEKNQVTDRVVIDGYCDVPALAAALPAEARTLVLCDVEGFEDILLDPARIPGLRQAWLLVELHDSKNPGVSQRVGSAFESTHNIETLLQQKRTAEDFPLRMPRVGQFAPQHLAAAVDEGRPVNEAKGPPISWFWMQPKVVRPKA